MKKFLRTLLVMAMALLMVAMTACAKNAPAEEAAPEEEANQGETPAEETAGNESLLGTEPVTITFWHSASDEAGVLMDKYVSDFNANNEYGITVNAIYQGQYSDATTMLKTILSAENYKELPDVMQLDATGKVTYFDSGKAFTIDDAIKAYADDSFLDSYLNVALSNWQYSGIQLGLPFATSTTVTYYNKDLLAKAGWDHAPATFSEVIALQNDMKAAGLSQVALQSVPNTPTLANWIGQLNSYVVNNDNGSEAAASELACIDNGALATFLTEWKAMYDAGALKNEQSSTDAFVAGDVALMTSSSSAISSITEKVNGAFEVGVSNYIKVNDAAADGATVSGSCLVMFDSGEALRKEASWYFLQYLTSANVQADFAAGTGYIPCNAAALETDAYKAAVEATPAYKTVYDQLTNTPASMRSVTVGPSKDFYYAIMQCVSDMLEQGQTVDETVEIMSDELSNLLNEYIRNNQ